jgi:hypothetical protein
MTGSVTFSIRTWWAQFSATPSKPWEMWYTVGWIFTENQRQSGKFPNGFGLLWQEMWLPWRWQCYQWGRWLAADEGDEILELPEELTEASARRGLGCSCRSLNEDFAADITNFGIDRKLQFVWRPYQCFPEIIISDLIMWKNNIRLNCVV